MAERASIAAVTLAALLLGGCVTAKPSSPAGMTVAAGGAAVTKHDESLSITVSGGSDTSALGTSKISNEDFAEAIKTSITQSGLFTKIAAADQSQYQLLVQIVRLDQPFVGLSLTVTLEATWRLVRTADHKVVWEKAVTTSSTATTSDAFAAVTRLRLANEGAARENIREAISQMSAVALR